MTDTDDKNRAALVVQAWEQHPGRNSSGVLSVPSGGSEVRIAHIEYGIDEQGRHFVDVWTGKHRGSPAFRICNPPTLVKDPRGDVAVSSADGSRVEYFRLDPVGAVAEVIAMSRGGR